MSNNPFFSTQLSNISANGDTGNLDVSAYSSILVLINITSLTGTSVNFRVRTIDNFGSRYSLAATNPQTQPGTLGALSVVSAAGAPMGDIIVLDWVVVSATFSANISIYAK